VSGFSRTVSARLPAFARSASARPP
jgi:hypothetical protein